MASLDYTNIAGSSFQPYVHTQIEKRKKLIDNEKRSPAELQWLTNKNAWIRVSSGVDVGYENENYGGLKGDALSKKYILQSGIIDHTNSPTNYKLRSGIGPDSAYGIGGNDFGLVPMPGITNISVGTGGKLGTLKEITVDFMCYNIEQLNIMEALYMKLGYGLLIEWGHTFYIDNDTSKIENVPIPLPFYGIHTQEELLEQISSHRKKYSGNYDASWGTIKNFTYSLSDNGSFKCQVKVVGAGDILESLKINLSGEFPSTNSTNLLTSSIYPVVSDQNESLLNSALYKIYHNDVVVGSNTEGIIIDWSPWYISWLDTIFKGHINVSDWGSNPELVRKGFHHRLINKPGMNGVHTTDIDNNIPPIESPSGKPNPFFSRLVAGYEINGEGISSNNDINTKGLEQVYITLGNLLLITQYTGMLLQKKEEGSNPKPYIYIDVNPETNRCYTFSGHCSIDPTVCLIGSETLPFGITSETFNTIKTNFPFYGDNPNYPGIGDADLGGKFMYTLVNIDWVAGILKKLRKSDSKGDINFVDFLQEVLSGISKATGGYNEFRIVPDDDSRCIRILDDRRVLSPTTKIPEYTQIPVLGKKSLVYGFSYSSKITPKTAAMVTIAAQAQPYGVQGAENALAFSHLNKGLYNRLNTITVDAANENNKQVSTNDNSVQRYVEIRDLIEQIYDAVGTGATAVTAEENKQAEAKLGVKEKEGIKTIPKSKVKTLILERLKLTYEQLRDSVKGLKNTGEINNLQKALNKTLEEINSESDEDLIDRLSIGSEGDNIRYTDKILYNILHDKLENSYKSLNTLTDTKIETIWTTLTQEQTGTGRSWY